MLLMLLMFNEINGSVKVFAVIAQIISVTINIFCNEISKLAQHALCRKKWVAHSTRLTSHNSALKGLMVSLAVDCYHCRSDFGIYGCCL